jgi:hypothetical protein
MHSGTYTPGLQCYGPALQCYGLAFIWLSRDGSGFVSGMRIRILEYRYLWKQTKITNKPCYLPLKVCFFGQLPTLSKHIFHVKIQFFVSDQDLETHWFGSDPH